MKEFLESLVWLGIEHPFWAFIIVALAFSLGCVSVKVVININKPSE